MLTFPKRVALVAVLATVGALSFAGPASAEVAPPEVNEKTLTVTSNDVGDSIALAVAGGFISVNGTVTTLAAGANDVIVVNAAGGNDTVDATALATTNYESLTVNGGEGDDLVTGGANGDVLHGDGGEDRLVGFKGKDVVTGGAGNDVMVWNNGDASDRNDGEGGVDEVEVNGAPTVGDDFSAKPNPTEAGSVLFERLNLVKFEITLRAERLTVNGLGGPDHFAPDSEASTGLGALTSLAINGGSGGDRRDGGDGDDRIVGGTGEDQLGGRAGDDTIVWNNGDGSDPNNDGGPGFDRVEVNGAATAGDAFALAADAEGAGFVRKNLVPFTLEISSDVEALAVNGSGGEDTFSVIEQGSGPLVAADGGAGNDVLSGSGEADSLFGGSGEDTVTGGGGADLLDGGEGADRLFARDGAGDLVRGGAGEDAAQTDRVTVDAIDGVEDLDATPVPQVPPAGEAPPAGKGPPARDTSAILPTVGRVTVTRSHGRLIARAPVSCPTAEAGGCRTALTLETARAVRLGKVRAVLVLGSTNVALGPGQARTASVRVSNAAAGLASHGRLPARISVSSSDAAGNSAARSFAVGLRFPRL
jgi:Ca2+-binding RTX toxin-like protein